MAADEATAEEMLSSSVAMSNIEEIDSVARAHFTFLQQSIGQNFISILNDPNESEKSAGGWMTGSFWDKSPAETPVRLSKIPVVPKDPITQYIVSLGGSYNAWRVSKKRDKNKEPTAPEAAIQSLPSAFYQSEFHILTHPEVLEELLPDCGEDLFSSQLLLSKLEFYAGEVGQKLLVQVKQRSPQFFVALQNFNDLKARLQSAVQHVSDLRSTVAQIRQESVTTSLETFKLQRRARNQQRVKELCLRIQSMQKAQISASEKVAVNDYAGAISDLEHSNLESSELQRLCCTRNANKQLDEVKKLSFKAIRSKLLSAMVVKAEVAEWPDLEGDDPDLERVWREKLEVMALPLLAQGATDIKEVLQEYKKRVYDEVKKATSHTITQALRSLSPDQSSMSDEEALKPARLRGLSVSHFNFILEKLFEAVFLVFRRTYRITTSLDSIIKKAPMSGLDAGSLGDLLTDCRSGVIRMIQTRMNRMFEIRQEEHASLRFAEIYQTMSLAFKFILRLEDVSSGKDTSASFRATLATQVRGFFKRQHDKQQQKLLEILHSEQWQAENEIDVTFQALCDRLTDESPESIAAAKKLSIDKEGCEPIPDGEVSEGCNPRMSLGKSYYCVSQSVLMLLRTLADYEHYVFAMPFLGHDVSQRVHDLLKVYDGQTAALILGAGARETAGIETITVAHLAVSASCLAFLADFSPRFRRRLEAVLPTKSVVFLKNLERFSREAIDHRNEFYLKIVLMMKEGLKEWRPELWGQHGSGWITGMLKDVGRLLKKAGLERLLEKPQLRVVIYPILYSYYAKMKACISGIKNLSSDAALVQKVKEDILHFKVNIENFGFSVITASKARDLTASADWLPSADEQLPEPDDEVLGLFLE